MTHEEAGTPIVHRSPCKVMKLRGDGHCGIVTTLWRMDHIPLVIAKLIIEAELM